MSDPLPTLVHAWRDHVDEAAARQLVEALYPLVTRIVRRHAIGHDSPEDLAQEVFGRVFARLDRYDERLPLENWVARIALNVCRNRWKHQARRPELRWEDLSEGERTACEAALVAREPLADVLAGEARSLLLRLLTQRQSAYDARLKLTDGQIEQLRPALEKTRAELYASRERATREVWHIMGEHYQALYRLLTPEQQAVFQQMIEERKAEAGKVP